MHFPDRVLRAPLRPIAIGIRIEVRFKDRFQQQLRGGLHHPVPYGRDSKWTLAPARLRDVHPTHGLWCIRLCSKVPHRRYSCVMRPLTRRAVSTENVRRRGRNDGGARVRSHLVGDWFSWRETTTRVTWPF